MDTKAFGAKCCENQAYGNACRAFGFDPVSLITLIMPIVMEMLKDCIAKPSDAAAMIQNQGPIARAVIDRATRKAVEESRKNCAPGSYRAGKQKVLTDDIKSLSRPVLSEAASLSKEDLVALLGGKAAKAVAASEETTEAVAAAEETTKTE